MANPFKSFARTVLSKAAGYTLTTRGGGNRPSVERSSEDALMSGRKRLEVIACNRDDNRNTTFAPATALQLRNNVIGTIGGRLTVTSADGKINTEATNTFRAWAKHAEFTRGISLNELLGLLLNQLTHLGGDFIAVFDAGELTHADAPSYRVKVFEPDQIRNIDDNIFKREFGDGYTQTNGIVTDKFGRVCAAFVGSNSSGDTFKDGEYLALTLPVPGDFTSANWIHCCVTERPNMARGIAPISHLAETVASLETIKQCEIASAKANSGIAMIFSETDTATASPDVTDFASGSEELTPAQIAAQNALAAGAENSALKSAALRLSEGKSIALKLRPNTKVESFDTKRPNLNTVEFYDRLQEASGTVFGLPQMYVRLKPQGSYSGSRAEMALARPTFEYWQKFIERNFLDWLAERVLRAFCMYRIEDGFKWSFPAPDEIDEGSHQTALQKMYANGEKNLVDIHGADTEAFLDRRAAETEMFHARGLIAPWEITAAGAVV